jgi:hypothetical protein
MKKLIASAFLILVQGGLMVTKAQEYSGSYGNNVVEGIAKYYGKNLTGNLTSYGERYDDATYCFAFKVSSKYGFESNKPRK